MTRASNSTRASVATKLELYLHKASGHWCKTIKGRRHYFGKDEREALDLWHKQKDDLLAGKTPKAEGEIITLKFACNYMLTRKSPLVESGDLSIRQFNDLKRICQYACDHFGANRSIESLSPDDFGKLRDKMTKRWAPSGLVQRINNIRQVFRFAYRNGIIEKEVRFGDQFSAPNKRQRRKARHERGERMFEADEIRLLLSKASPHLKAFILLAANTGIGNADICRMEPRHINLETGWLNYPRGKTQVKRRAKLWEETCEAIRQAVQQQTKPKPKEPVLFWTEFGNLWHNEDTATCQISRQFSKLAKAVGVYRCGNGFYALRHVAETIGGECRDQVAVDTVLGHDNGHISGEYRERISDERLEAVADTIYAWLYRSKQDKPR